MAFAIPSPVSIAMTEPNQENIRKWVRALRSGEFAQTRGFLSKEGAFCCLGVACEVAIANGVPVAKSVDSRGVTYDGFEKTIPFKVEGWLGLRLGSATALSNLNDCGALFGEIASTISEMYLQGEET